MEKAGRASYVDSWKMVSQRLSNSGFSPRKTRMTLSKKKTPKNDDRKQLAAFRKAARELGCDDSEERFKDALRTVAKAKPSSEKGKQRRADQSKR